MTKIDFDLELTPDYEVDLRRDLIEVALGQRKADSVLTVGRMLDVHTRLWRNDVEIAIYCGRIAYIGPRGTYQWDAERRFERSDLSAVPGLGEVHKHIESSHVTPEYEAQLVIPHGNTWTMEASHEFSNVAPQHTLDFWLAPRRRGSPLKIFPLPGSAVPPTAWEHGAHLDGTDQAKFLSQSPWVKGLDEVMDWPAVKDRDNPAHGRLWSMIKATWHQKAIVEGHAAGIRDLANINGFAASGIASDHEAWTAEEAFDKLQAGLFVEIRIHTGDEIIRGLIERGLKDWSQVALATDDRPASEVLDKGATDRNVRMAIAAGLSPEIAIQMATINPARHMQLTPFVGSIAPGRFADFVLLNNVETFDIKEVWADGTQVSDGHRYLPKVPKIDWPDWATNSIHIDRQLTEDDFAISAEPGCNTMMAAVLRPFHWTDDFLTYELPVESGLVQRDKARKITKFSIIDRYAGTGAVAKMFWLGCGPSDDDTALCCSMAHDKHNIWCVGSSDASMAHAVNICAAQNGGWVLVHRGKVTATVPYEIAGLMTAKPATDLHEQMQNLYHAGDQVSWMFEPSFHPRWQEGFPERLAFATLTCSPWRWNLVAPSEHAKQGLVQVQTGQTHPVVWQPE